MSIKVYGDKIYEQQFSTRVWGKYPSEEVIRFFMRAKKELRGSDLKALDIGCGTGACSWTMAKEGAMVTAIDGAPSGLEKVNALAREFGVNATIEVVHCDITRPKAFLNSTYDIMVDNYALYSNKEVQTLNGFREFFDLLKTGGLFLTCCFGKKTTGYGTGKQLSKNTFTNIKGKLSNGGVQSFFSRDELDHIFCNIGYRISYYENIIEDRNGELFEKHITCLSK